MRFKPIKIMYRHTIEYVFQTLVGYKTLSLALTLTLAKPFHRDGTPRVTLT